MGCAEGRERSATRHKTMNAVMARDGGRSRPFTTGKE